VPAVRKFGLKEVSLNQIELQVGFYPFRGPEASLTLIKAYHTTRGVLLPLLAKRGAFCTILDDGPTFINPTCRR